MDVRSCLLISTSLELPEVFGPVWYGMPLLQTIASELRHAGYVVDGVEQFEDGDGGLNCTVGKERFLLHLIDNADGLWMLRVSHMNGCFWFMRKADPAKLRPMLEVLDKALTDVPAVTLQGWIQDRDDVDPSTQNRFSKPF